MGSISSKEQLMAKAIENQDINAIKIQMQNLTSTQKSIMCNSLVPKNINQCTMLHYAAWQDNPDLLAILLEYADDLEIRDGLGWTPLMTAVNRGSKENVKMLLKHDAKINCDALNGMNLIAISMGYNDIELIKILMEHGAQVTMTSDMYNNNENFIGCYLLHFAVDDGLYDVAKLLIEKGKISVNTLDQAGWSPLHLAAEHNYLDIVKLLLENGAEINIKDRYGNTPLAWAKQMNADDVIDELERHDGIADKEWHGEKLRFYNYGQEIEDDQELHGIENGQFEIEESVENKSLDILDALQRQR